ncbi:Hypothetical protein R9X50_00206300 [Acrodontium crateriforme]|uniref:Uncharacterized protein n=1 Tax=Acrodontium crateriforme TaxID=150365 RepID=A0AAQ3M0U0_9PEZI|nr:Hypothetical protein R9X50_00206300 [Acrodontium crateriforme]
MFLSNLVFVLATNTMVRSAALPTQTRVTLQAFLADGSIRESTIKRDDQMLATLNTINSQADAAKILDANFLNFNSSVDLDVQRKSQLLQGWKDAVTLAFVTFNEGQYGHPPFSDYFALSDGQNVRETFYDVWNGDGDVGSRHLRAQIFDNRDYAAQCKQAGNFTSVVLAYTATFIVDGGTIARTHVCDEGYKLPALSKVTCNSLGDTVSNKMDILGGILLQQWIHFDAIGKDNMGRHVGDVPNGYGPANVRELLPTDQAKNAANYRWFALETFWRVTCKRTFADPRISTESKIDL